MSVLFAFGGRSHEYHHALAPGVILAAACGAGDRASKGAPTWATKDDVPSRLEECQACAKAVAAGTISDDGTAEPLGDCRTCSLGVYRFPEGPLHQKLDGTFTLKGRGGCKAPVVRGSRKPLPRLEPESPAPGKLSDALALRHEVEGPGAWLPPVPRDGVAEPPPPAPVVLVQPAPPAPAAAVGEPAWYLAMVGKGCDMLRHELSTGQHDEAVRTAEVLLFVAQRARDRARDKGKPAP